MRDWRRSRNLVSGNARDCAPGPQGRHPTGKADMGLGEQPLGLLDGGLQLLHHRPQPTTGPGLGTRLAVVASLSTARSSSPRSVG